MTRFIIISCFGHGGGDYISGWHNSILAQDYHNYRVVMVDDGTHDETFELLDGIKDVHGYNLVINAGNEGLAYNLLYGLKKLDGLQDEDVIVILDGDDKFAHGNVLSTLASVYEDDSVWLTYGNFKRTNGVKSHCSQYRPNEQVRGKLGFRMSHLKTAKWFLYRNIPKDQLMIDGKFIPCASDRAIMTAMGEMAGLEHVMFINEVLYIYNTHNPNNLFKRPDYAKMTSKIREHWLSKEQLPKQTKKQLLERKCDW